MGFKAWRATGARYERAWTVSLMAYAMLFMLVSGMRLVAPSAAMGLAMLQLRQPRAAAAANKLGGNRFVSPRYVRSP